MSRAAATPAPRADAPPGICTQDPRLVHRLDVDRGAQNIVDYMLALDGELRKLMAPIGNSSLPVGRSDALVTMDRAVADKLGIQYAVLGEARHVDNQDIAGDAPHVDPGLASRH